MKSDLLQTAGHIISIIAFIRPAILRFLFCFLPVHLFLRNTSISMSTTEKATETTEGKKAVNAPPTHLGWDSHKAVVRLGFGQLEMISVWSHVAFCHSISAQSNSHFDRMLSWFVF